MAKEMDRRTFLRRMTAAVLTLPQLNVDEGHAQEIRDKWFGSVYHQIISNTPFTMAKVDVAEVQQPIDCPIYMFHKPSAYTVESVIYDNRKVGRTPVTVAKLTQILLGEEAVPEQPIFCLSFDDGYLIQYQQAFAVLKKWWVPATFFVMGTGWQGDGRNMYMFPEQIQEIYSQGFEIGSHTVNHANLLSLRARNRGAYLAEIFDSKVQLEGLLQQEGAITSFAYPMGAYDAGVMTDVQAAGYKGAVSTKDRRLQTLTWLYELGRKRS